MPSHLISLLSWTANNDMQINIHKTKEMIIGPLTSINLPPLLNSLGAIERVSTFKLLGIHLDTNLSWSAHISITSKASKRLYFLKQLKRAGVPYKQLLHFYTAVIRPVLSNTLRRPGITSLTAHRLSTWNQSKNGLSI